MTGVVASKSVTEASKGTLRTIGNRPQRGSLNHADFQKFMKRLRKHAGNNIRYYMGGEYGPTTWRPHFHACIFGHDYEDKLYFKTGESGEKIYTSKTLEIQKLMF